MERGPSRRAYGASRKPSNVGSNPAGSTPLTVYYHCRLPVIRPSGRPSLMGTPIRESLAPTKIRAWYDNVARGSRVTADLYARSLRLFGHLTKTASDALLRLKEGRSTPSSSRPSPERRSAARPGARARPTGRRSRPGSRSTAFGSAVRSRFEGRRRPPPARRNGRPRPRNSIESSSPPLPGTDSPAP